MSQGNNQRSNSIKRGENSDLIPTDLIMEICSRLPAKSIGRFRCVSKLWGSMLRRPYFTDLFMTMSSARPRLLFGVKGEGEWLFYSAPHLHNPYKKSSLVVAADFHTKFSEDISQYSWSYASGLIYFPNRKMSKEELLLICNPITGQYSILPELQTYTTFKSFLGFDPIDKQFKVLVMTYVVDHILTLETGKMRWRMIKSPLGHYHDSDGICINGVLYYLALGTDRTDVLVCFEVRSESFKLINLEWFCDKLINYKGKLGAINLKDIYDSGMRIRKLYMWILEDVEKHEWSKYVYILPVNEVVVSCNLSVVGVTTTGEIVLSERYTTSKPFYVFYFNPERNTLVSVEIQGLGAQLKYRGEVYTFVDHVEDLRFIDANQLKSSIYAPSEEEEEEEEEAKPKYNSEIGQNQTIGKR